MYISYVYVYILCTLFFQQFPTNQHKEIDSNCTHLLKKKKKNIRKILQVKLYLVHMFITFLFSDLAYIYQWSIYP